MTRVAAIPDRAFAPILRDRTALRATTITRARWAITVTGEAAPGRAHARHRINAAWLESAIRRREDAPIPRRPTVRRATRKGHGAKSASLVLARRPLVFACP